MANEGTQELSERTIDRDVRRGTKFLGGLSLSPEIRRVLVHSAGYTEEEHERGWSLLLRLMGRGQPFGVPKPAPTSQEQAIAELDLWDGPAFSRARATLDHRFPDQSRYASFCCAQARSIGRRSARPYLGPSSKA